MKKLSFIALILMGAVSLLSSCSDNEDSYHALSITSESTASDYALIYADQQSDELKVLSTDSWTATSYAAWTAFGANGQYVLTQSATYKFGNDSTYSTRIIFTPNTTDSTRIGVIRVVSNKHTVGLPIYQTSYLNITSITPVFTDPSTHNGAQFSLTTLPEDTSTSISFRIFQPATLSSSQSWVTIPVTQFLQGKNTAEITLEPNTTGQSRTAIISITSECGVKTDITLTQKG